nr:hypothetical protein [Candidatus Gracilibacteria bacterium]
MGKNEKLKLLGNSILKNFGLFLTMLVGVILIFVLIGKFYHWDRVDNFYLPFAFTTDGIFSNNWMFVSVLLYSIIGLVIIVNLFKKKFIKDDNTKTNKWYYKIVAGTFLGVYLLFYITNPWYTLQTHPRLFLYQDGKNITNKNIYFFLTERYGFNPSLYKPFKTLDDSIDGLEFAMRTNNKSLYSNIFFDLEKYGYENVFKKYNDVTFQAYFLKMFVNDYFVNDKPLYNNNINVIGNYKSYTNNKYIIEAINYIETKRDEYKGKEKGSEYYVELSDKVLDILKNLIGHGVNNKILNI